MELPSANARQGLPASLQVIAALAPQIRAMAAQIEQQRALPEALTTQLKAAGAFRALIPAQFGGLQAPFERYIELIQNLASADASTAWCVNQGAVIGLTSLWLPPTSIHEIWQSADTAVANGPPIDCVITPADDAEGYVLHGRWGFSSGCQHATWMNGAARSSAGGWRLAYFRPQQVTFNDNWQVAGLRGTGSFEFSVTDLHVGPDWVADQSQPATVLLDVTQVPLALLFACSFSALALGVAAGALQDVLEIAQGKLPRYASLHLRDDPDVQRFIGQATARWQSGHAYLHSSVAEVFDSVRRDGEISSDQRAQLRLAST